MRKFCQFYHGLTVFCLLTMATYADAIPIAAHQTAGFVADSTVNITHFGIYGDSLTDYTDQIQEVLSRHSSVYFPAGTYIISQSLRLQSGQTLTGVAAKTTFVAPASAGRDSVFAFLTVEKKDDIAIRNIRMVLPQVPKFAATALRAIQVTHLTIKQVHAVNCGIVETWIDRSYRYRHVPAPQEGVPDTISNYFIEIDSCVGVGAVQGIAPRTTGVLLRYANHWTVKNSRLKGYYHGVQWWGGDSHPARDGDTAKVRKSINGLIHNVVVDSIRGGGIWGSMGERIRVEACRVSHCTDVGIDFEGCFHAIALHNEVKNCKNGGLATFHYNKNVVFEQNQVVQYDPEEALARIYNATQRQDNGKIVFRDNTFTAVNGVGFIDQHGPSKHIVFVNNTLHNVVLNLNFNNNHRLLIEHNSINITRPIVSFDYMLQAGQTHRRGVVEIKNNHIVSKVAQNSHVYAISIYQSDYNSSPRNYLVNNTIEGLAHQFRIAWAGNNPGIAAQTYIESEDSISTTAIKKVDTGKKPSEIYLNGKRYR